MNDQRQEPISDIALLGLRQDEFTNEAPNVDNDELCGPKIFRVDSLWPICVLALCSCFLRTRNFLQLQFHLYSRLAPLDPFINIVSQSHSGTVFFLLVRPYGPSGANVRLRASGGPSPRRWL